MTRQVLADSGVSFCFKLMSLPVLLRPLLDRDDLVFAELLSASKASSHHNRAGNLLFSMARI